MNPDRNRAMIGNDVVDLKDAEALPGAQHPRFDARVFAARERDWVGADASGRRRWLLWACKEAAFKVARKLDRAAVWAPARFVVEFDVVPRRVRWRERVFDVAVHADEDCVHACAWHSATFRAPIGAATVRERLAAYQREANRSLTVAASLAARVRAYALARACVALALRLPLAEVEIATRGRIPFARHRGAPLSVDVSLSHHGRFVACALALEEGA